MAGTRAKGWIRVSRVLAAALICLGLSTMLYGLSAWLWTLPLCGLGFCLGSARRRRRARRAGRSAGLKMRTLSR